MKYDIGNTYHGFMLKRRERIDEINGTGEIYVHEKSGASLCHLECEDDNKVFAVGFRTPPLDSTGAPHILEHSVLCGSKKFPSKEPFVELAKGSLNTFLNAMTFPDKTLYPVASRNEQDLFNLMEVYLDAVFFPNIYSRPEIFMQEGWHHELPSPEAEIDLKGVVYNEMLGAFSTPEEILFRKIQESLFPNTAYRFESGGDPDVIPDLTYETFIAFHERYYHPGNSYLFLYGDVDTERALMFLDGSYLSGFGRADIVSAVDIQKPFKKRRRCSFPYPISSEEKTEDKTYLSLNWAVDAATNPDLYMAFGILEHMLLDTPAAPIKMELLKRRIGKDVFGSFERSILQPVFSVVLKNSNKESENRFIETVNGTLTQLVEGGIDRRLIEASVNLSEFKLREADFRGFPKGLVYYMEIMDSWLYEGDPFVHLRYEPTIARIRKAMNDGYFEGLLKRHILENSHSSLVVLSPNKGLEKKRRARNRKKLAGFAAGLGKKERSDLIEQTERLKKRQSEPDTEESLGRIPLLGLEDIDPKAEKLPLEKRDEGGTAVLAHPLFTNKITYVNLMFDTSCVPQEHLPYLSLFSGVLAKVSTSRFHYSELVKEINIHTGGIGFDTQVFPHKDDDGVYYPKLVVTARAMTKRLEKLLELVSEIICNTRYDETDRLREIVQEAKSRMEIGISEAGHTVSIQRLFSYFSPAGKFAELLSGLSFYKFISRLEKSFDSDREQTTRRLEEIAGLVFDKKNLLVSVTGSDEDYREFQRVIPLVSENLGDRSPQKKRYAFDYTKGNEGLCTPAKVQFVAKGYNFRRLGYSYSGTLDVLRTIASLDFLWNRIRVQGGAYGSFARFARNGNMFFCSYRDPCLKETLGVYDEAHRYISAFDPDEREMRKYIIGTIGALDSPLTPSMKGEAAAARYITGITQDDEQGARDAVLATDRGKIRTTAKMVRDSMNEGYICVTGNEQKLRENSGLFKTLVSVFE
ncbi:MAG: insulinase family protein [Spirochaetes bacterium]|nr:insulinase family protein [Spirochaetota bacterium]